MDELARLVHQAERIAATGDRLSAAFALELARVWRQTERAAVAWIGEQGYALAGLRSEVRNLLTAAGFDDLAVAVARDAVDTMAGVVLGSREIPLTALETRLEALRRLVLSDLFAEADTTAVLLVRAVRWQAIGRQPMVDILDALTAALDRSQSRVRTLFDTQVSILGRHVEALHAEDLPDDQPFLYAGPIDDKTREFCLERVGKVYTRAAIDDMDNGQIPGVFLSAGGYNCRHSFMAVESQALRALTDTGEVVPAYKADLARAKERRAA